MLNDFFSSHPGSVPLYVKPIGTNKTIRGYRNRDSAGQITAASKMNKTDAESFQAPELV